jgi:hypothetical protein
MARDQRGAEKDCKSRPTGSIPALASTKYASLADMHWYWRYGYWPMRQVYFKFIEYPMIQKTNAFMKPIRIEQEKAKEAIAECGKWREKYITISKEVAKMKRNEQKDEK